MFRIRAHSTIFNFIRSIVTILNPERPKKFRSPASKLSVWVRFLRLFVFLCVLCTTNSQIRCEPRKFVVFKDTNRRYIAPPSLVAAPPRCVKAIELDFQSQDLNTEDTEKY